MPVYTTFYDLEMALERSDHMLFLLVSSYSRLTIADLQWNRTSLKNTDPHNIKKEPKRKNRYSNKNIDDKTALMKLGASPEGRCKINTWA